MPIPFFHKDVFTRNDCAIHCLRMALAAFGVETTSAQLYEDASSFGDTKYTVPWGICHAAALRQLYVTFISVRPFELTDTSLDHIVKESEVPRLTIEKTVQGLIQACQRSRFVHLVEWRKGFERLPEKLVKKHVVIPSILRGTLPHNVVITGVLGNQVNYYDPNDDKKQVREMPRDDFQHLWLNKTTDNDLLIISKSDLDLNAV